MPLYIAFEGGEGSGKSTQARLLADRIDAVLTYEPGATPLGARLRKLLLDVGEAPVGARAETLMMAADRAQHLEELVGPALEAGRHVVSDRTAYSSLAYQGGGRNLGVAEVRAVNDWALGGRWADLVILLDCDLAAAQNRRSRSLDRLESEDVSFHERVRSTFRQLAEDHPDQWVVVDGDHDIDSVAEAVWAAVALRIGS